MTDNKLIKKQEIILGGKSYNLIYNMNSFCELDNATGIDVLQDTSFFTKPKSKHIVALVWAGLLEENPEITLKEVGSHIGIQDISYIMGCVNKALSFSDVKTDNEEIAEKN